jgi:hypothetical protein
MQFCEALRLDRSADFASAEFVTLSKNRYFSSGRGFFFPRNSSRGALAAAIATALARSLLLSPTRTAKRRFDRQQYEPPRPLCVGENNEASKSVLILFRNPRLKPGERTERQFISYHHLR